MEFNKKWLVESYSILADDATPSKNNNIPEGCRMVNVEGVVNNADDFVILPNIASVPLGFSITILCNAGSNFEIRTPATSGEKINNEDCDGTKEYLATDTDVIVLTKKSATNWIGVSYTNLGAVRTAVVPD